MGRVRPSAQGVQMREVRDSSVCNQGVRRNYFYELGAAAMLIVAFGVLNANAVMKLCRQIVLPTWEQMKAKRDKEKYLKTRPWYERASAYWTEKSPRYTKGITKVLGVDEAAGRKMKREMDSLGIDEPLDYYKWLKTQKGKH